MNVEEFRTQLLSYIRTHNHDFMTYDGRWTIKGL